MERRKLKMVWMRTICPTFIRRICYELRLGQRHVLMTFKIISVCTRHSGTDRLWQPYFKIISMCTRHSVTDRLWQPY